jgi:predicted DNA-binding transcriptional regulator AlpA
VTCQDPTHVPLRHLIGNRKVRQLCGNITRHTLLDWRKRRGFPEPVRTIDRTEIWDSRAVRAWLREQRDA